MSSRIVQAIATVMAISALSIGSAKAEENVWRIMYAATLNAEYRLAEQCNEAVPGFLAGYELHLGVVEAFLKSMGFNEELRKKAETDPELASHQVIGKFQALTVEDQLKLCIEMLLEIHERALEVKDMGVRN